MELEEVEEVERRRLRALVEADLPLADELHADDFQLVTPSGRALSKQEYLGAIASGAMNYLHWEPEEIAVRVHGDAGCLRYVSTIEAIMGGRDVGPARFWHVDFYERRHGRWQVVWSQATEIRGGA